MDFHTVVLLSLIALCVESASAIRCYSCESVYDAGCGEDFDLEAHFKLDCARILPPRYLELDLASPNASACMKREYKEKGVPKVERSCFFGDVNDTDTGCRMDPTAADVHDVRCYVCDDESYCNGSRADVFQRWPIVLALGGFVSLAKWLNAN